MDLLRVEGEPNFLALLPEADRLPTLRSRYLGDDAIENVGREQVPSRPTRIAYETDEPRRELVERVVAEHLRPDAGPRSPLPSGPRARSCPGAT